VRFAWLVLDSWAGRTRTEVEVLELGARVLIRAIDDTKLAGRCRTLRRDETARVPIGALVFQPQAVTR
jgi:hypothetical protein